MKTTTTAAELRALLTFAHCIPEYTNLRGICVSSDRLAATNGHAIAIAGDNPGAPWTDRYLIPYDAVACVAVDTDPEREDEEEVIVSVDPDTRRFSMIRGVVEVCGPLSSGKFPDVAAVVGVAREPSAKAFFDPGLVAKLTEINKARDDGRFWWASVGGPTDPIVFTCESGRWTVLIMPGKP
ncbi:MAG: hypothetical protein ACRCZP_19820 [Phycicoccus sp.]